MGRTLYTLTTGAACGMPVGVPFRYRDFLGQMLKMRVSELLPRGAQLVPIEEASTNDLAALLLPRREMPESLRVGDTVEVFLYLDSEDRPIATTLKPKVGLGEVAFLEVVDLAPFGAFVDWGLKKQLLVPFAEQICDMQVGKHYAVGLMRDDSGRLAGTMRVSELLRQKPDFRVDDWVAGEAWRSEPRVGVFVIVDKRCVGLLPATEPHRLKRGQSAQFRIANVLPDGKIELSLRRRAVDELDADANLVLSLLTRPNAPQFGDHSDPNQVRAFFNLSKKAFKRAVGRLLKQGRVGIDAQGYVVVLAATADPAEKTLLTSK